MAVSSKASQDFVPIKEIRNGVVIMKDGSFRSILLCSSVNFSLKSPEEQKGILAQFQNFLNSLDFPVQISIQSRRLDIKPYLEYLASKEKSQVNDLMRIQLQEYISFIKNFTDNTNIMTKNFFLVTPYTGSAMQKQKSSFFSFGKKKTKLENDESFEQKKTQLDERTSLVDSGLRSCGLRTAKLDTEEIIELFYRTFNPGDTGNIMNQSK